ncbi:coiled-coil domain-containing protein [Salix suchowensis]|nr:coiled-coil domain-containing protein [Salix suchowensis]
MWGMIPETLSPPDGGLNTWLFMEPSPSASAELVSNQFPKTTDANLNTQVSGATSTGATSTGLLDKAYRERCKELKMNTEIKMDELAKENDRLRRENDSLKKEQGQLVQTLQHQKDEMTQPEKEFGKLQDHLNSRNMVVELLLKQSTGSNNKDLQLENAQLKHYFNQLKREISNPENINVIQLEAEIEHLENKMHSMQVIIDALCEKIYDDQTGPAWTSRTSMTRYSFNVVAGYGSLSS